jgi:plastocyanin
MSMTTSKDLTFVGVMPSGGVPRPARRRRRAALGLAAALALIMGLAACGGDDDDDDATSDTTAADNGGGASNADATLEVTEIAYNDVSAPAGGTLEIVNSSGTQHTFTADDGEFDVTYDADETTTVDVPAEPGEYPFHCEIHPSMTATLTAE